MTNEIGDKSTEIAEKTPGFQDLEASHAEKTNSYEQLKKDVVGKKITAFICRV
jgi:hypothetical protein